MDTKTFNSTPEKLQELANMLAIHGVILNPNEAGGELDENGWDIKWLQYPGAIELTVIKHPFAEEGFLWGKLTDILGPNI